MKERFGIAILFDAHSIKPTVPRLFEGRLDDFNLGTADGTSASPHLSGRLMNVLSSSDRYSTALDQRFKGGYITRQYGRPEDNIHVVQLQLSQATYMDDVVPHKYRNDVACQVRPVGGLGGLGAVFMR